MQVIIVFIVYSNNYIHLLIIIYIQTNCLVLRNKKKHNYILPFTGFNENHLTKSAKHGIIHFVGGA